MKEFLLKIYYWGNNSKEKIDFYQKIIRDTEWQAISAHIPEGSYFLDIGCGTGYFLELANKVKNCIVKGIDPEPYSHGVGRFNKESEYDLNFNNQFIDKGFGESLPYPDSEFDLVFSSHVIEHTKNPETFLKEAKRVLKENGTFIIGMPTSFMAFINLFSNIVYTTHQRLFNFIFSGFKKLNFPKGKFKHIFLPPSHSFPEQTVFYDLKYYRVKNWEKMVSDKFEIEKIIYPAVYPFPDYLQLFRIRKNKDFGSSVFFICRKKT